MLERTNEERVDGLLSAAFAALTPFAPSSGLSERVRQALEIELSRPSLPRRIQIVEQRYKNRLLRVVRQSGWAEYDTGSPSPPPKALPYTERVRTTHVFTGKETYEFTSTAD